MVDNKDKNGTPGDFDEDFDVEDFSESDFDEAAFDDSEISDLPEDEFADEDFAEEEWQEGTQDKKLLSSGEKKGLSFNAMVMIGAFVVGGGVLALNIMNKSDEQAATASSEGGIFQSMLNISGVMDGDLFGSKDAEKTPEEKAAQAEQTQNEGFLNNPDNVIPSDADPANPPQPTPIAPPDETVSDNEPLTPMPEGITPRGPEDGTPESRVAIAEIPIDAPRSSGMEEAAPSAEDILKKAMANREQKSAEAASPLPVQNPIEEVVPEPEIIAEPEVAPLPVAVKEEPIKDVPPAPVAQQQPSPVTAPKKPPIVATLAPSPVVIAQNTEALDALDGRLEDVLKRMEQIETDLGSVKNSKQTDTRNMEQTIQALKAEIAELKSRPVATPAPKKDAKPVVKEQVDVATEEVTETPVPKKAAPKKVVKLTPAPKAASASTSSRWELRAAQPGRAWVSKPGERDMQSVEVGQTISGIGRITSIVYQNGRWSVQGTQGQINQ